MNTKIGDTEGVLCYYLGFILKPWVKTKLIGDIGDTGGVLCYYLGFILKPWVKTNLIFSTGTWASIFSSPVRHLLLY